MTQPSYIIKSSELNNARNGFSSTMIYHCFRVFNNNNKTLACVEVNETIHTPMYLCPIFLFLTVH